MISKYDLATYIINKLEGDITPLKLQKLIYYVNAWGLVNQKIISNCTFYAWKLGPVDTDIYEKYKSKKSSLIGKVPQIHLPENADVKFFDFIVDSYNPFSTFDLSDTTHFEDPWKLTPLDTKISEEIIISYYSKLPFAKNFPIEANKTYFAPITNSSRSFSFDMGELFVPEFTSLKEYVDVMKNTGKSNLFNLFMEELQNEMVV